MSVEIVAAAVRYGGLTISIPAPARHNDVLAALYAISNGAAIDGEQGFLGSDGVFYSRTAARIVVEKNHQRIMHAHFTHSTELFSEDIF